MLEDKLNGISCGLKNALKRAAVYSISAIMGLAGLYAGIKSAEAKPEERQEAVFYDDEKEVFSKYGMWRDLAGKSEDALSVDSCKCCKSCKNCKSCESCKGCASPPYGPQRYE